MQTRGNRPVVRHAFESLAGPGMHRQASPAQGGLGGKHWHAGAGQTRAGLGRRHWGRDGMRDEKGFLPQAHRGMHERPARAMPRGQTARPFQNRANVGPGVGAVGPGVTYVPTREHSLAKHSCTRACMHTLSNAGPYLPALTRHTGTPAPAPTTPQLSGAGICADGAWKLAGSSVGVAEGQRDGAAAQDDCTDGNSHEGSKAGELLGDSRVGALQSSRRGACAAGRQRVALRSSVVGWARVAHGANHAAQTRVGPGHSLPAARVPARARAAPVSWVQPHPLMPAGIGHA